MRAARMVAQIAPDHAVAAGDEQPRHLFALDRDRIGHAVVAQRLWRRAIPQVEATISAIISAQAGLGLPAKLPVRLAGIALQGRDLCGAEISGIDPHHHIAGLQGRGLVAADRGDDRHLVGAAALECQLDAQLGGGPDQELADRMLLAGGDDIVVGTVALLSISHCMRT